MWSADERDEARLHREDVRFIYGRFIGVDAALQTQVDLAAWTVMTSMKIGAHETAVLHGGVSSHVIYEGL